MKKGFLLLLVFGLFSCSPEEESFLSGARFNWYRLENEKMLRFTRWDHGPEVEWKIPSEQVMISSLFVDEDRLYAGLSPLGILEFSQEDDLSQSSFQKSPYLSLNRD